MADTDRVRAGSSISPLGMRLSVLLLPHVDAALPVRRNVAGSVVEFRFTDAPAATMRQALGEVPSVAASRPNGQPPAGWLLEIAEGFSGRLCGSVNAVYGSLRVDAVCLPAEAAAVVGRLLADAWPGQEELAIVEAWSGWDATDPLWEGTGRDVIAVEGASVYSFWWD